MEEVDFEVDFHSVPAGTTPSEIALMAREALEEARGLRARTVRVIVGKGLHSEFGPVVKPTVEECLVRWKRENSIVGYAHEIVGRGQKNEGAIIVRLI